MRKCKTCGIKLRKREELFCKTCFEFHSHHYTADELEEVRAEYARLRK